MELGLVRYSWLREGLETIGLSDGRARLIAAAHDQKFAGATTADDLGAFKKLSAVTSGGALFP